MDIITVGEQPGRSNSDVEELTIVNDPHEQCMDVAYNKIEEIEEYEEKTDEIVAKRIKGYIDAPNLPRSVVDATLKKMTSFEQMRRPTTQRGWSWVLHLSIEPLLSFQETCRNQVHQERLLKRDKKHGIN